MEASAPVSSEGIRPSTSPHLPVAAASVEQHHAMPSPSQQHAMGSPSQPLASAHPEAMTPAEAANAAARSMHQQRQRQQQRPLTQDSGVSPVSQPGRLQPHLLPSSLLMVLLLSFVNSNNPQRRWHGSFDTPAANRHRNLS